jgi:nucleoporin p58/p45
MYLRVKFPHLSQPEETVGVVNTLNADHMFAQDLKSKVDQSIRDIVYTTRILDGFKNIQQHGINLKNHANFPLESVYKITCLPALIEP